MGNVYSRAADLDWDRKKKDAAKRSNEPSFGVWSLQQSLGNQMTADLQDQEAAVAPSQLEAPRSDIGELFKARKPKLELLADFPPSPETPTPGLRLRKPSMQDLTRNRFAPDERGSATTPPSFFQAPPLSPTSSLPRPDKDSQGKEGSAGDVVSAVSAIPAVKTAIDDLTTGAVEDFQDLSTGKKVVIVGVGATLGASAIAALSSNAAARQKVGEWLDGKKFPVPGVDGLELQIFTKDRGGAGVHIDFVKLIQQVEKLKQKRRKKRRRIAKE
jgi:hypothetical protein